MERTINCPACHAPITLKQLFRTPTLLRFKCPHCGVRVQPESKTFGVPWLIAAGVAGLLAGAAAGAVSGIATDGLRAAAYAALAIAVIGAIVIIKWRASLALIDTSTLKVAP